MVNISENYRQIMLPFETALKNNRLIIPESPDPNAKAPRRWLIRGESSSDRLLIPDQQVFKPQSGQMGSYGVFLGDCLAPLMYHSPGAYYLFDKDKLDIDWLRVPSSDYNKEIERIGKDHNLRLEELNGGLNAETMLFKRFATYQPNKGVATIPYPLSLEEAVAIFLTDGFIDQKSINSLPDNLKRKIKTF